MRALLLLSVCVLFFSCSNPSSDSGDKNTVTTTLSGTVQAPDNTTPISGATVFVGDSSSNEMSANIKAKVTNTSPAPPNKCKEPSISYVTYTCTEPDGSFEFEIGVDETQREVEVKVEKGIFYFSKQVSVSVDGRTEAGSIAVNTDNAKIAVISGLFDRMQDVLAKVGFGEIITSVGSMDYGKLRLGTETFDLYNGTYVLGLPEEYPPMRALFDDGDGDGKADINNYDIVFINCGAQEEVLETNGFAFNEIKDHAQNHRHNKHAGSNYYSLSEAKIQVIRNYVLNGGVLYVTDQAYDYIEQAFPEEIDFLGEDDVPADVPEYFNEAEQGNQSFATVEGAILDEDLTAWLGGVSCGEGRNCLNNDGRSIPIRGFLSNWAVINGAHEGSAPDFWVQGMVKWSGGSGTRPLTTSFAAGEGRVIYSSYHTIEDEYSPEFNPQERVLQYFVFE